MIPLPGFEITKWQPHQSGLLVGFLTIQLEFGLTVFNLRVCANGVREWVALPNLPRLDRGGQVKVDLQTGRRRYDPVIGWPNGATADRFSDALIAALKAEYPGALDA